MDLRWLKSVLPFGSRKKRLERSLSRWRRATRKARSALYAARAGERLREAGRPPRLPVAFRSQYGEDAYLWDLFGEALDGFFIEVGAYDGYTLSVSYAFEAVGWEGLLVEALPERQRDCAARRPGSRVVHAALSRRGSAGTATFTSVEGGDRHGGRQDMLSFLTTDAGHRERVAEESGRSASVTVPLTTMDDLLREHSRPIEFAVIDVEGGERDLLDGFDLDRFRPRVLVVEDNTLGRDAAVHDHLSGHGYAMATCLGVNRVYIRGDDDELWRRAEAIALAAG